MIIDKTWKTIQQAHDKQCPSKYMQPQVQFWTFVDWSTSKVSPCIWSICRWRRGGPLYRVITVAPPTLAMVPRTFANPSLLVMLTSSSLVKIKWYHQVIATLRHNIIKNVTRRCNVIYLKAKAKIKVIAGTEFCKAEAKVGEA